MLFRFTLPFDPLSQSLQESLPLPEVPTGSKERVNVVLIMHSQSTSRVTSIYEIWTEFRNLHVSFDFASELLGFPCKFPLFIDGIKLWFFSLHCSIKNFKNNNCFSSILNFVFSVNASERFPEKSSRFHSNAEHYKVKFECSFHSRIYSSCVM